MPASLRFACPGTARGAHLILAVLNRRSRLLLLPVGCLRMAVSSSTWPVESSCTMPVCLVAQPVVSWCACRNQQPMKCPRRCRSVQSFKLHLPLVLRPCGSFGVVPILESSQISDWTIPSSSQCGILDAAAYPCLPTRSATVSRAPLPCYPAHPCTPF